MCTNSRHTAPHLAWRGAPGEQHHLLYFWFSLQRLPNTLSEEQDACSSCAALLQCRHTVRLRTGEVSLLLQTQQTHQLTNSKREKLLSIPTWCAQVASPFSGVHKRRRFSCGVSTQSCWQHPCAAQHAALLDTCRQSSPKCAAHREHLTAGKYLS